ATQRIIQPRENFLGETGYRRFRRQPDGKDRMLMHLHSKILRCETDDLADDGRLPDTGETNNHQTPGLLAPEEQIEVIAHSLQDWAVVRRQVELEAVQVLEVD
ncbi:MAG TPA: hypothetical protein VG963_25735, partial [Polyangiaceae bacterium]|nr:hypothetical protein [Polyangiaceae bacterium]